MTSPTNPPEVPFDTVLDEIILDLVHQGGFIERGKTINAGMFPEQKQRLIIALQALVTAQKPEKLNSKHSETEEEYVGKEWYNQAADLYETNLLKALKGGEL